jgi:hypothetical protein
MHEQRAVLGGIPAAEPTGRPIPRWRLNRMAMRAAALLLAVSAITGLNFVNSPTASASGEFCNNQVCFTINTGGLYVGRIETTHWTGNQGGPYKAHVWSTNGQIDYWTRPENVPNFTTYRDHRDVNQNFPSGTRICVEGWAGTSSVGLPCATITP